MSGPLSGVRVIDATTMLSGPWATMILADQGADVIKVETPGKGDHIRSLGNRRGGMSSMFLNINRNKRSIALDLKNPAGVDALKKLVESADIFVQNFRPGVMQRLGLGYEALKAINPKLIYLSISGFGDEGPWVGKPVYDPVIQAVSGLTTIQAGSDGERPRLIRTVLPDKLAAVMAAQTMTAALVGRGTEGQGQHIRLSMLDSVLYFLWASDMGGLTYPDQADAPATAASFIDLIYETADGHMTVSIMSDKEWRGLCTAFEKPEWLADERFCSAENRDANVDARLELTQDVLKTMPTAHWMALLEKHDVPCAPALTRREVIAHPQVIANNILLEYHHPAAGPLRQTRAPARFEKTPTAHRSGAPLLNEHGAELLAEVGYDSSAIEKLRHDGALGLDPEQTREQAA
ncbi:CoA transferase [Sphingopyxis sp. OPL5]|uniref:CaiB/BaiF CoA transferase family protein n=1 Tax=Sphingopyxis sp. OPL5 TaxID=2486273 RepID=UPI00164D3495|nr:CoA transferase [Sphingopyxis sp. OPL5]QNO27215.1 CoA transferase [Sphingopyxis sp. OPL5]